MDSTSQVKDSAASVGDLLGNVTRDLSQLMRQEVELAKAELRDSARSAGKGVGLMGGATYAAGTAVLFVSIAAWWAFGDIVGLGWSALVVAVVWAIVAIAMYAAGRKAIANVDGTPETIETLKKIPETLKKGEDGS